MNPSVTRLREALMNRDAPVEIESLGFGMSGSRAIAKLGVCVDGMPHEVWLFDPQKQALIPTPGMRGFFWTVDVAVPPRGSMAVPTVIAARFVEVRDADA